MGTAGSGGAAFGEVSQALQLSSFVLSVLGDGVSVEMLPTVVFVLSAAVALATGSSWGTLAIISGGKGGGITITNERACILVANIHFLVVSLCAAFCPLPFQDTLLLEPGEPDEEPAGLVPAFDTGLTPAAELWNGRLAMLGLIIFAAYSMIYQIPFLNAVDNALGGLLLAPAGAAAPVVEAAAAVAEAAPVA
mgnify:CR=1 FL=1